MGQVMRIMSYDRAGNEKAAIPVLQIAGHSCQWFRLDDGVMGGQSETLHEDQDGILHFTGTINTNGGGFTSIRSKIPAGSLKGKQAVQLSFRGDGKTYKLMMTDGHPSTGGPWGRTPSWQADLPTKSGLGDGEWQETTISLSSMLPSFGGAPSKRPTTEGHALEPAKMTELGLMLSLKRANGDSNPPETFGQGIFPFSLRVKSIQIVDEAASTSTS